MILKMMKLILFLCRMTSTVSVQNQRKLYSVEL